jgi:hypothetical protein
MNTFSRVSCISQYRQVHVGTHIYHVYNILSDLTLMLDFLVITDIAIVDFNHDGHI